MHHIKKRLEARRLCCRGVELGCVQSFPWRLKSAPLSPQCGVRIHQGAALLACLSAPGRKHWRRAPLQGLRPAPVAVPCSQATLFSTMRSPGKSRSHRLAQHDGRRYVHLGGVDSFGVFNLAGGQAVHRRHATMNPIQFLYPASMSKRSGSGDFHAAIPSRFGLAKAHHPDTLWSALSHKPRSDRMGRQRSVLRVLVWTDYPTIDFSRCVTRG